MCGIAGILAKQNDDRHGSILEKMIRSLKHRGPDGEGMHCSPNVLIGMRRLSIIDISGGCQPLYNEDRSLVLVMNGEIYNYIELQYFLESKGHRLSTKSDCEVILHLYEEYQFDCLQMLRGMFAFVIYDIAKNRVFIARDRMGEKPLYIFQTNELLLFSSEMKSLLSSGNIPFELDPVAINEYFHYQFVPEPKTAIKGVRKLPRASYLDIDVNEWRINERLYWDFEAAEPVEGNPADLIRQELDAISSLIVRSDVPVGVALSGGLDSSAIAALTVKKYPESMQAFSVGYPGRPANDERNQARELANLLGMQFHEIELTTRDLVNDFERLNFFRDDPIADISGFGYYSVSQAARKHGVPVLLQGQGGDELFWGYQWVKDAAAITDHRSRRDNPLCNLRVSTPAANAVTACTGTEPRKKHRPLFYEISPDFRMSLEDMQNHYTDFFIDQLNHACARDLFTFDCKWSHSDILITRLICDTYLLENGIAQGDRLCMANSVELRLPFVDHKLVELVIGLRKTFHEDPDYRRFPKPWLKGAMEGILPDFIIQRPKQGFAPPVHEWHHALFSAYGHYLNGGYLVQTGVLSKKAGSILSSGPFPKGAIAPVSFKALVLEIWCRMMSKVSKK